MVKKVTPEIAKELSTLVLNGRMKTFSLELRKAKGKGKKSIYVDYSTLPQIEESIPTVVLDQRIMISEMLEEIAVHLQDDYKALRIKKTSEDRNAPYTFIIEKEEG